MKSISNITTDSKTFKSCCSSFLEFYKQKGRNIKELMVLEKYDSEELEFVPKIDVTPHIITLLNQNNKKRKHIFS